MAENKGELNKTQASISRRDFLKKTLKTGAVIGAGLVVGGTAINAIEVSAVKNGIDIESGFFFPLYETHWKDIDFDRIPEGLDVLFRETVGSDLLVAGTKSIFEDNIASYGNTKIESKLLSGPMLKKIVTEGVEVMVGDVDTRLIPGFQDPTSIDFFAGIGLGLLTLKKAFNETKNNSNISRRKFLKIAGTAGTAWLMSSGAYFLIRGGPWIGKFDPERDDALHRTIDRINGLQSSTHPEQLLVFFRNLIMADKMLAVAEDIERKTGKKAKIGFNVEYGHNGIEDFLRVGHDICRWIISQYPKPVLRGIADINGGNEGLWTARLFKLPKDFFEQDPEKRWEQVGDRKVIDVGLKQMLEKKLS